MMSNNLRVSPDFPDRTICVMGLGFVGITLATTMASLGFEVIGVDIRNDVVDRLASGDVHFHEPGLSDQIKREVLKGHLAVFRDIPHECRATVYVITVGTPLRPDGKVNLDIVEAVSTDISPYLKDGDLVVLRSTVKLGTTRNIVRPILERTHKRFQLAFCPERTVEGEAMSELRYLPQIIGADSLSTALRATQIFQFITPTVVRVSDFETAEMIKLVDNTKRDVVFAYANEVARLCDAIGISAQEVISSGRFGYSRTDLPMPGPVGGPCLSKDPYILAESMAEYGLTPEMTLAARQVNERQPVEVVAFIKSYCDALPEFPPNPMIALLGFAFKGQPPTDDIRGTTALTIIEELRKTFPRAQFVGYDPVVDRESVASFGIAPKSTLVEAIGGAHLALILNNHPEFVRMSIEQVALQMRRPGVIYDFWNCFTRTALTLPAQIHYVALGSHRLAQRAT